MDGEAGWWTTNGNIGLPTHWQGSWEWVDNNNTTQRILDQATYALRDPDEYGDDDNLGLEDRFAERTEEGLKQGPQAQEMDSGDETSPDVLNDDNHELFEDYIT